MSHLVYHPSHDVSEHEITDLVWLQWKEFQKFLVQEYLDKVRKIVPYRGIMSPDGIVCDRLSSWLTLNLVERERLHIYSRVHVSEGHECE